MTIIIEGHRIKNLEEFYEQIENFLHKGECPWGQNLDSLQEIVQSSFNYTDDLNNNVTEVVWQSAALSEGSLGKEETRSWWTKKLEEAKVMNNKIILEVC
jgi:RNAse (barnase) inhibitor barstar